jgi:hypothetical protein
VVNSLRRLASYFVALFLALFGFIVLNFVILAVYPPCADCHAHIGFPFAYLDGGGIEGGGGMLWLGAVGDLAVVLVITLGAALAWQRHYVKRH